MLSTYWNQLSVGPEMNLFMHAPVIELLIGLFDFIPKPILPRVVFEVNQNLWFDEKSSNG